MDPSALLIFASISTLASIANISNAEGSAQPSVSHPTYTGPIIKHIPRSARQHIAAELSTVLSHICSKPDDVSNWSTLLEFGSVMLRAPPRAGRRHNLASVLNKRSVFSTQTASLPPQQTADHQPRKKMSGDQSLATAVMSKIEDGNIKAAIRIITSGDSPAVDNDNTYQSLCDRHPQAPVDKNPSPDPDKFSAVQFTEEDVLAAISSFPAGSAGGPDGVRPQHLRDLTSNKETGPALVKSLTAFINHLMMGKCPSSVTPIFFGGRLLALQKKLGGIRPIAIGYSLRRLAAKCVNKYALNVLKDTFNPSQLGVGVSGGCEAAIHATRRFLESMPDDHVAVKIDFSNAFNCIRRDSVLAAVANAVPEIYRFCHLAYNHTSILQYGNKTIESQEGVQQGDPLGPLLFSLVVHPLLTSLRSNLAIGYLDDFTLGGPLETVAADVASIRSKGASLGLSLNAEKSEVISHSGNISNSQFAGFRQVTLDSATLLGAPIFCGQAMDDILSTLLENLKLAVDKLQHITAHDALVLLKTCLGGPKLQYILRVSPCCDHPLLLQFDEQLRLALTQTCNITLTDDQWNQASLPVWSGGLGVRSVFMLASSAFLASAAGTLPLQSQILRNTQAAEGDTRTASKHWLSISGLPSDASVPAGSQRILDAIVVNHVYQTQLKNETKPYHRARLLAAAAAHSGDWLHAVPISACGLRLNNEAVRVAVGLRLGSELCQPYRCICGAAVDTRGSHALSCRRNPGRSQRHHLVNDLIWRSLSKAGFPSIKEPQGLLRTDGKRPDGLTLTPWKEGRCATWDVTVTDTVAASYLNATSACAGSAAEAAAKRKEEKYAEISATYHFFPLAFETFGPINHVGSEFLCSLGQRLSLISDDPRETSFLFQRLSVSIQRFNSVCFYNSFGNLPAQFFDQPRRTYRAL